MYEASSEKQSESVAGHNPAPPVRGSVLCKRLFLFFPPSFPKSTLKGPKFQTRGAKFKWGRRGGGENNDQRECRQRTSKWCRIMSDNSTVDKCAASNALIWGKTRGRRERAAYTKHCRTQVVQDYVRQLIRIAFLKTLRT